MQLFDPNNPNEKKKLIAAGVLGVVAMAVLGYVFFGGNSNKPATNRNTVAKSTPSPNRNVNNPNTAGPPDNPSDDPSLYQPVVYSGTYTAASEPNRNIFAYYEPPPPTPIPVTPPPTPTPTPTPPLTATTMSPLNVYAGTPGDFSMQVMGDKFTPAVHIFIDGRDMPTRFVSARQVATTVPAAMIANPGTRQVIIRSPDGALYSNMLVLTVTQPPVPNYAYIGIIGRPRGNDTAVMQEKTSKELQNMQRGETLPGGRFRVVSISDREVIVIDTNLKIRHPIPFTDASGNPVRPATRSVDDEP